ncbi:MAG: MerR family transcriptional regulator [Anaerolineales bacterium]|nr:MerR family transcriptional regulator [Anaerolineales bacterium]
MLWHYDGLGLLKPVQVDPATGYRYYSLEQLEHLQRLRTLTEWGLSQREITSLLALADPEQALAGLLQRRQRLLRRRIATDQARLIQVEAQLHSLGREPTMSTGPDSQRIAGLLLAQYQRADARVEPFPDGPKDGLWRHRVQFAGGDVGLVYSGRADHPQTEWLHGHGGRPTVDFLLGQASLLRHLAEHGYPAPRVVANTAGQDLSHASGWTVLVTQAVSGAAVEGAPESFRGLGAALGWLHTLPLESERGMLLPPSWLYADHALAAARHFLEAARAQPPADDWPWLAAFEATLLQVQSATRLPRCVVHGGAWLANAVWTAGAEFAFGEWHSGGAGVAILDLGRLLLGGHRERNSSLSRSITPDDRRVQAVLEGYCQYRIPTSQEVELLPAAIRSSVAYGAAEHLAHGLETGWTPRIENKLARRWQWYQAAGEIATLSQSGLQALGVV